MLDDKSIQLDNLEEILRETFSDNKDILGSSNTNKTLKTNLRRAIKMYDWLKFSNK